MNKNKSIEIEPEQLAQLAACLKDQFEIWISEVHLSERQWEDAVRLYPRHFCAELVNLLQQFGYAILYINEI